MPIRKRWLEIAKNKNSLLCVGLDPAEHNQRPKNTIPQGMTKLEFCLDIVTKVAPFASAVKINRNYIKDLSREEIKTLNNCIHSNGMLSIDDCKLGDIGDTNATGLYHSRNEGYDLITYAPFPGNIKDTIAMGKKYQIGIITLVLMSNPEYELIKKATIDGMRAYEFFANQVMESDGEGIVVGAPSHRNHISVEEIERVNQIAGERLILVPGIGAQGGELERIIGIFKDYAIINVGRAIIYAEDPGLAAKSYQETINRLRL